MILEKLGGPQPKLLKLLPQLKIMPFYARLVLLGNSDRGQSYIAKQDYRLSVAEQDICGQP